MPVNEYKVTIRGMKYFIKTEKDLEFVNSVVRALNEKIKELEDAAKAPDTQKLAIMAAFSFAAELSELRAGQGDVIAKINELIDKTA